MTRLKSLRNARAIFGVLVLLFAPAVVSCAHALIPGTQTVDTPQNREVLAVVIKLRDALINRDSKTLLSLVSKEYFEDGGTPDPTDDYGYLELKEKLIDDSLETAREMFINFQIFEIVVDGKEAYADIRYNSRARLELPSGRLWDTHRDFDRLDFVREEGTWRIVSGL